MADSELTLVRFKDPNEALGLAAHLLARKPPLNAMPLGQIVGLADGAIKRGHYVFAKRGDRAVGLLAWGFSDFETAEAWAGGNQLLQPATMAEGPCVLLLCLQAESKEVARFLTQAIRDRLFPDHHIAYFIRVKSTSDGGVRQKGVRLKRPGSRILVRDGQIVATAGSDVEAVV
jgi:hemolysin-activating ACP:hemolysin acyltransferase